MRAWLLLASVGLGACAMPSGHLGAARRSSLRLDTESSARVRHASMLGTPPAASTAPMAVASRLAPALLVLLHTAAQADELEQRLVECARQAERQVNASHFGERAPTREECGEELSVDGCDEPITRAMLLGRQKHALALACAREVLTQLWPAPFSLEQRYRFYRSSRILETISRDKEAQLVSQRCTHELRGSIKPDIVLHAPGNVLQGLLTLDFKFPCPPSNPPLWTRYGQTSPYAGSTQGQIYREALGGEVLLLSPRGISE